MPENKKQKVAPYKPKTKEEEIFRKQMYADSLELAKDSRKNLFIWPNNPNISKNTYDSLSSQEQKYPYYTFSEDSYKADKKNNTLNKNFKFDDYIFDSRDTTNKSVTGKNLPEEKKSRENFNAKVESGWKTYIDKNGNTVEENKFTDQKYITDSRTGIEKSVYTIGDVKYSDIIHSPYIKPDSVAYKGSTNKLLYYELNPSKTKGSSVNNEPIKWGKKSTNSYKNYTHQTEQREYYPFPKQKILNADKDAPKGEKITVNNWNKIGFQKKVELPVDTVKPKLTNFEQRIQNPALNIKNKDGSTSTHKMMSFEADGKYYAAPTIVQQGDSLVELPFKQAVDYAFKNKEFKEFKTNQEASDYANNGYKKGTPLETKQAPKVPNTKGVTQNYTGSKALQIQGKPSGYTNKGDNTGRKEIKRNGGWLDSLDNNNPIQDNTRVKTTVIPNQALIPKSNLNKNKGTLKSIDRMPEQPLTREEVRKGIKFTTDVAGLFYPPAAIAGAAMDMHQGDKTGALIGLIPGAKDFLTNKNMVTKLATKAFNLGIPNKVIQPSKKVIREAGKYIKGSAEVVEAKDNIGTPIVETVKSKLKNGGWLDGLEGDKTTQAPDVTNATEYIKNWYNSPMYGNILRNQIADAGIKSPKRTERIVKRFSENFNQDLNNSFYNVTPSVVRNPEEYGTGYIDNKGKKQINLDKNFVEGNPKLVNSLFAHELAHDNLITYKDKEYVNKNTPEYNPAIDDEIIYNKLTDPGEVRSQIHSIRQLSGENKIYDPLTQPFKKEYLDKVNESYNQGTKDSENYNQLKRLRKYYSDDQITEMMNTISKSNSNDGKVYAKNGGWLDGLSSPNNVIEDNRGQWAHPGKVTKINSNQITMKGVNYPVLGVSDSGDTQMMKPGGEYNFKGKTVTEYPQKFQPGGRLNGLDGVDKGTQVPDAAATAKPVVDLNFAITPAQKQLAAKNKRQRELDDNPASYNVMKDYVGMGIKEPGLQTPAVDPIDLVGTGVYKGLAKALGAKEVAQGVTKGVKGLVSDASKYAEKKSVKPIAPSGSVTTTGGIELDEYLTRPINGHMPGTPEWIRLHDIIISNRAAVAAATPKSSKLIHKAKELERNITIPILNSKPALKVRKVILDKINKEAAKSGSLFTPENLEAFKKSGLMHGEEGTLMSKELSSIYNGDVGSGNLRNYLRERFLNNKKLTNEDLKFFSPDRKFSSSIHLPSDVNPVGEFSNFSFSNRNAFSAGKTAVDLDRLISSIPGKWNFNPGNLSGDSYPMWSKIINKKATPQFELSHEGFEYMNTYGRNTKLSKLVKERAKASGKLDPVKANEFLIELEKLAGKTVDQWKLPKGSLIHPNQKETIPSLILRKKYKNGGKLNNNKSNWLDNLK